MPDAPSLREPARAPPGLGSQAFARMARVLVPTVADGIGLWRAGPSAEPERIAGAARHPPPSNSPGEGLLWARERDGSWVARVEGPSSEDVVLALPLSSMGLWVVVERHASRPPFDGPAVERVRDIAILAAEAAQGAAHYQRMVDARTVADRASHRWAAAARVSQRLAGVGEVAQAGDTLLEAVVPYLGDYALLDLVLPSGELVRTTRHVDPEWWAREPDLTSFPFAGGPARDTVAELPPGGLWIRRWRAADTAARAPAAERSRVERLEPRSVVIVPLVIQGARQGALTIVSAESAQEYDANDRDLFRQIAIQAGLALSVALTLDEVRRARMDREDMLAVVSHDLRNPLNVLGFAASLLRSPGGTGGERMERQLEIIERSITQMDELIANLLDAARIDGGRFTVERELLDPEHLVREAVERMRPLAEQGEVLLETVVHPRPPPIEGDRARLLQTFQNLLSNALSFTPAGGSVTVSADVTEDGVAFEVRDTGPGIDPEALPYVFDRYWQSRRQGRAGAGLGLTIARGIVLAHDGTIDVRSTPGAGATFRFVIPFHRGGGPTASSGGRAPSTDDPTTSPPPEEEADGS